MMRIHPGQYRCRAAREGRGRASIRSHPLRHTHKHTHSRAEDGTSGGALLDRLHPAHLDLHQLIASAPGDRKRRGYRSSARAAPPGSPLSEEGRTRALSEPDPSWTAAEARGARSGARLSLPPA
ncbi:hypothetical protein INR49_002563 [Caranx melampygus]|nr:hypothetical protein INR49_002563 [Caranx melampygus]